jgi:hypothetical protein
MHRLLFLFLLTACSDYEFITDKPSSEGETGSPVIDSGEPETSTHADTWDLREVAGIDVLFFGDTSGSMAVELTTLGEQVTAFVDRLVTYTSSWQLLAVTGPDGCGVGGVLTPDTPEYAARFAEGITTPPGEDNVDEWGLYNSLQAVEKVGAKDCNAGFLRDEARLHVIFISDEDDNSPGWDKGNPDYWRTYTDAIVAAKGDADQVVFSGVIGPAPDGCKGAEPGTGYAEAIAEYGGELLPICDAWYKQIDLLVDASVAWPIFRLSQTPVEDTLAAYVNGTERDTGWTYVPTSNTVVFTENIPTIGDEVAIAYELAE